jgi:hypothetical protein
MDTVIVVFSVLVVVGFIYFVFFREGGKAAVAAYKSAGDMSAPRVLEPLVPRDFTLSELSKYNGRDGNLIYLAGVRRHPRNRPVSCCPRTSNLCVRMCDNRSSRPLVFAQLVVSSSI